MNSRPKNLLNKRPSGAEFRKRKKVEDDKINRLPKIAKFFQKVSY